MEIPILSDIIIILGLSVLVILLFQKFKLPSILGFLVTGIIAGPYGLSLIEASHEVEIMAEIGIILLLFIIGLEFSLKRLSAIKKTVLVAGTFQVFVTIAIFSLVAFLLNFPLSNSLFIGFLFSLSSTAIVLKILQDKGEINSPHGKIALGILIFQDIIVVPMMLVTPILAGEYDNIFSTLLTLVGKTLLVVIFVFIAARYIFPRLLFEVAKTRSKELFILTITVSCFSVAWLTSSMGLSLALGAFIAGLIISESDYSHQATSNVLPFREIFTSFFFVSIGMLLNLSFLFDNLLMILLLTVGVCIIKGIIASGAAFVLRYPPRVSILTGLSLFQVGEFAFILSKVGLDNNMLSADVNQYFLSVSIISMAVTPFVLVGSGNIINALSKSRLTKNLVSRTITTPVEEIEFLENLENHIIIVGFGVNGRNVAKAARYADIPYVIIELNAATVKEEKANGEPIIFGDAVNAHILEHIKIWKARVAVIAISDPAATKNAIRAMRAICHTIHIIIRTRFINEMDENLQLGADEVIPEEFETSIEIFTRVLSKYLVPQEQIEQFVASVRADNYKMLRPKSAGTTMNLNIPTLRTTVLTVQKSSDGIIGKKLEESDIRNNYNVNLIAIQRNDEFIVDLKGSTRILENDVVYLLGTDEAIEEFRKEISF
ncbi:MAG: cation:proton antiporter domain-containing protein [Candidatus Cyclobacteriaceae bacterium M2_1C_046]